MDDPAEALTRRLTSVCGLGPAKATQIVAEVLDEFAVTVDEFIAARHEALQRSGRSNAEIYRQIRTDLAGYRFRAPPLSDRQIRRRIYG
jgi:hypothetical protein